MKGKMKKIIIGRKEVVATVFVPWDCTNNCSFCRTKQEYRDIYSKIPLSKRLEGVKKAIINVGQSNLITEYVFTGGEPLLDIATLKELIKCVPAGKKIFVNASLVFGKSECGRSKIKEAISFLCEDNTGVTAVSVSCPIAKSFEWDFSILTNDAIKIPFRINSVVDGAEQEEDISRFLDGIIKSGVAGNKMFYGVVFRKDYTRTSQSSLNSCDDQFFMMLMSSSALDYKGSSGCLVCRTDGFKYNGVDVSYHRGVENTHLIFGDKLYINDFVIKQDGEIRFDWNDECVMTNQMLQSVGMIG